MQTASVIYRTMWFFESRQPRQVEDFKSSVPVVGETVPVRETVVETARTTETLPDVPVVPTSDNNFPESINDAIESAFKDVANV